jgi:hypothetical protein
VNTATPEMTAAANELREAGLALLRAEQVLYAAHRQVDEALASAEAAGIPRADWLHLMGLHLPREVTDTVWRNAARNARGEIKARPPVKREPGQ